MNIFDELLSIKQFRENQAELAVTHQRQRVQDAQTDEDRAQRQLDAFRTWAESHELDLYGDLCSRVVHVREIEYVLDEVANLREREQQGEERLQEAATVVQQETDELTVRRDQHREAARRTEKFIELARIHLQEHLQALEKKEDLEMEEVALLARDHADWSEHDEYEPA